MIRIGDKSCLFSFASSIDHTRVWTRLDQSVSHLQSDKIDISNTGHISKSFVCQSFFVDSVKDILDEMHECIGNIVNDLQSFVHIPTMMMTRDDASSKLIFPSMQLQFFFGVHCSKKEGILKCSVCLYSAAFF